MGWPSTGLVRVTAHRQRSSVEIETWGVIPGNGSPSYLMLGGVSDRSQSDACVAVNTASNRGPSVVHRAP